MSILKLSQFRVAGSTQIVLIRTGLRYRNFINQWNYQHVGAYFDLLRIGTEAEDLRRKLEGSGPRTIESAEDLTARIRRMDALTRLWQSAAP